MDTWRDLEMFLHKTLSRSDKEIISVLHRKYLRTHKSFRRSKHCQIAFRQCIERITAQPSRVYIILHDLKCTLKRHSAAPAGDPSQRSMDAFVSSTSSHSSPAGSANSVPSLPSDSNSTSVQPDTDDDVVILDIPPAQPSPAKLPEPVPSSSEAAPTESEPGLSASRKSLIERLEKLLTRLGQEIRSLEEEELDLDALDSVQSSYIQLHGLKRRYLQVWNRLCDAKRVSRATGRILRRRFTFTGSQFPEINRRIEELVNRDRKFPDYKDIHRIVHSVNRSQRLNLSSSMVNSLSRELFVDVGHLLKRRRQADLRHDFGCHLTDDLKDHEDPTYNDPTLRRQLAHNKHVGEAKLDEVFENFVKLQYSSATPEAVQVDNGDTKESTSSSETLGSEDTVESSTEHTIDDKQLDEKRQDVVEQPNSDDIITVISDSEDECVEKTTRVPRPGISPAANVAADHSNPSSSPSSVICLTGDEDSDDLLCEKSPGNALAIQPIVKHPGNSQFLADSLGAFPHIFPPRFPVVYPPKPASTSALVHEIRQTVCVTQQIQCNGFQINTAQTHSNVYRHSLLQTSPQFPRAKRGRLVPTRASGTPHTGRSSTNPPSPLAETELIVLD